MTCADDVRRREALGLSEWGKRARQLASLISVTSEVEVIFDFERGIWIARVLTNTGEQVLLGAEGEAIARDFSPKRAAKMLADRLLLHLSESVGAKGGT